MGLIYKFSLEFKIHLIPVKGVGRMGLYKLKYKKFYLSITYKVTNESRYTKQMKTPLSCMSILLKICDV